MKIRTDFVTNSSSSSYVGIVVTSSSGTKSFEYENDDRAEADDEYVSPLFVFVEDVLAELQNAKTGDQVSKALSKGLYADAFPGNNSSKRAAQRLNAYLDSLSSIQGSVRSVRVVSSAANFESPDCFALIYNMGEKRGGYLYDGGDGECLHLVDGKIGYDEEIEGFDEAASFGSAALDLEYAEEWNDTDVGERLERLLKLKSWSDLSEHAQE